MSAGNTPACGTPPRRRGGRGPRRGPDQGRRNTPASARRTPSCRLGTRRPAEHPRVGGENAELFGADHPPVGTRPRQRGGRGRRGTPPHPLRNTPASAGRTQSCSERTTHPSEHARVSGEDEAAEELHLTLYGTPPRRRGGHPRVRARVAALRNTSASAGRTRARSWRRVARPEHPRVGGEDEALAEVRIKAAGTPPRRRGGQFRHRAERLLQRNTPASAGRTVRRSGAPAAGPEHPRVGGEDRFGIERNASCSGTPPRRRGGR